MKGAISSIFSVVAGAAVALIVVAVVWAPAASAVDFLGDACQGAGSDSAACGEKDPIVGSDGIVQRAANLIAIVGGVAAIFGIIIGGFQFITAGGDSGKLSSAKKIIIYSIVGLIVIALSRIIIVFVVSRV